MSVSASRASFLSLISPEKEELPLAEIITGHTPDDLGVVPSLYQ